MNDNKSMATTGQDTGLQAAEIPQTIINKNADSLNDILLLNIKKLQDDPTFLAQAKEIREQVREVVNIAKVQVEMFKIAKS